MYQRKSELMGAPIDDELVLLHVDQGQYYSLKGSGPHIWEQLSTPQTVDDLVTWACDTFDINESQAQADIEAFIAELLKADAIDRLTTSQMMGE